MAVIERDAKIVNPLGMHARPAAEFVKLASRFKSAIEVRKDDLAVNGKSIMGVMMLAAECGSSLTIKIDGEDESQQRRHRRFRILAVHQDRRRGCGSGDG